VPLALWHDLTMSAIADWLTGSGESDRPILDQTSISGTFNFILEFDPESLGGRVLSGRRYSWFNIFPIYISTFLEPPRYRGVTASRNARSDPYGT
jgi:uncharacterized protein (TIGR03435 family)